MDILGISAIIIAIVIIIIFNNNIIAIVGCVATVEIGLGYFFSLHCPDTQGVTCFNSHYSENISEWRLLYT